MGSQKWLSIFFCSEGTNYYAASTSYSLTVADPYVGHAYVDLGLPSGTKWATMNVGASSESDYGSYFQYGKGSRNYDATSSESNYTGSENPLSLSVDTARQSWGGEWHMPTQAQCQELIDNTYRLQEGNGIRFNANGKSIFIPLAGGLLWGNPYMQGNGLYWTSTPAGGNAYQMYVNGDAYADVSAFGRHLGFTVRPVVG